jgi:Reverse transcriptase (RNA-dependent DNA polymerase)
LSALDDHFHQQWHQQMSTKWQREKRKKTGQGNWRLIRYCDDFVLMVAGDRHHAEALREEVAVVLASLGLRLAPEKTHVVHLENEGFTFLGFDIRRMRKRGTSKYHVYTTPSKKAIASIKGKVKTKTYRSTRHMDLDQVDPQPEQSPGGMGELLQVRGVQGGVQRGRLPRMESVDALGTRQVRGQNRVVDGETPSSLLRQGVEIRPQRGRVHRRVQRRRDPLPPPRKHDPDSVDPETDSCRRQLTSGQRHVERPVRSNSHAGCGGRAGETHREQPG